MKINKQIMDEVNWTNVSDSLSTKRRTRLTYVDLFSGAGGISKGFEMAGMEGVYGLDHFDSAVETYANNFDHPIFPDDFIFAGKKSKQLIQIGNAVPPILAKAIGLAIQKSYESINV